jgi:hypothetical protein
MSSNAPLQISSKVQALVLKIETVLLEPKSDLRTRRLKNFYAEAKFHQVNLPALRALLEGRRKLLLARKFIANLPPHRRAQVAALAQSIGDTSELAQYEAPVSFDTSLQMLR